MKGRETFSLVAESGLGMFFKESGSLASRFNIGVVADLIKAIAPLGPRDMLRRCFSDSRERTFSSDPEDFDDLDIPGRFVDEPGFGFDFEMDSGFFALGLGGGCMITGPPNLRLMLSDCSGNLVEKLKAVST